MKKKILFMITTMEVGGVEKSLLSLLSVLPREKFDVTVLFLNKQGGFLQAIPDWVTVKEVTWYRRIWYLIHTPPPEILQNYLDEKRYIKAFFYGFVYFLSRELNSRYILFRYIFKSVHKHPEIYDIAIAFQGPTEMIDYFIAYKVEAKKKISWVHFDVSKHFINVDLYKRLYRNFNKIYVVSKEAKNQFISKFPTMANKTDVVMNIVSSKLINQLAHTNVDFDEDYRGVRIVTIGRLSIEKGQKMAISVLARLRNNGYEARWYCIGEGPERKRYEKMIRKYGLTNNFILLGSKLNPYPYVARADIYVQTSIHEGYCLALAEARCLKKPIVTTDFVGANEQIRNGEDGWIVSANEKQLYEKIKFIIDDPLQQDKLSINLSKTEIDTTREVDKLINYVKV